MTPQGSNGTLHAFYDLAAAPNTFDVLVFLVLAEIERQDAGCDSFHLHVVPGPNRGFRADADVGDLGHQEYVRRNVVLGSHALMPTCSGATLCSSRESVERMLYAANTNSPTSKDCALVFPPGYSVHLPLRHYHAYRLVEQLRRRGDIPSLEPPAYALSVVDRWLRTHCGARKPVTITLRERSFQPERNSSLVDWGRFVQTVDPDEYAVIVLRDLERSHEPLPSEFGDCLAYPEGVTSIELRAALYRRAYLNLCVNNGPAQILLLDRKTRYLYFKIVTESVSCTTIAHHREYHWLEPGQQFAYATPLQRAVWEDDHAPVLEEQFRSMCERIERGRPRPCSERRRIGPSTPEPRESG